MGGQYTDQGTMNFEANEALATQYLRLKVTGDHKVAIAGASAEDDIGVNRAVVASAEQVAVILYDKSGTIPMVASAAITQSALVYPAASGKISSTAAGEPFGVALEAASGDGSVIEILPFPRARGPRKITDPGASGAVPVTHSGCCSMTSAAAETRTVAAPSFDGQILVLAMDVDGGDITLTVASAINQTGNNTITFGDAGDNVALIARRQAGVLKWSILVNDGTTLSTV